MACEDQQIRYSILDRTRVAYTRENVYMCIGEEVGDRTHCLGVVCWMKRIQKERTMDSTLLVWWASTLPYLVSVNCQDRAWY